MSDPWSDVMPTGWLLERIKSVTGRKILWNSYYRACRRIPKSSPVHGETSWKKINERRCHLIEYRADRDEIEFRALQDVAGEVACGSLVVQNFLLARKLRKLRREGKA